MSEEYEILEALSQLSFVNQKKNIQALARYKALPKFEKPNTLHEKIETLRGYHKKDPLFGYLIDSAISHTVSGGDWEAINEEEELRLIRGGEPDFETNEHEAMWKIWNDRVNLKLGNILPSIEEVDEWIASDLWITGMATLNWQWDYVSVSEDRRVKKYLFPVTIINYPNESVRLQMNGNNWLDYTEKIYIKRPNPQYEGEEGGEVPTATKTGSEVDKYSYVELKPMWNFKKNTGSFCVKYRWSPGNVQIMDADQKVELEKSLYPSPPLENCIPWLMTREALCSSDIQLIDGLINYILMWVVGDKDMKQPLRAEQKDANGNVVKKSDFAKIKELIEQYGAQKVLEIFLPWFVKPEFVTPPTETITNREKYMEATAELLYRFGILSPANQQISDSMNNIGYETLILDFRQHIVRFWNMLSNEIAERNGITTVPRRKYAPLPFNRKEILGAMQKGHQRGEISTETINRLIGVDPRVERSRVFKEYQRGDRKIYDLSVPIQFSQSVARGDEEETLKTSREANRPEGIEEKEPRHLDNDDT